MPGRRGLSPGCVPSARAFSSRAHIIGVTVSDTTSETSTAADSVIANSRNRRPISPPMKRIGMNTAISDRVIDSTVKATSPAPTSAARMGAIPCSMCRVVFSSTMIASSTTKPVAMVSAIRDRLFSEKPARYITPSVPTSDTGTATAGISAQRHCPRKMKVTPMTSAMAISSVCHTSRSDARMLGVRSCTMSSRMVSGIDARSSGISAWIRSTVSMMFAFGWRLTTSSTAGRPLASPALRRSCTESSILAMSPRRIGLPLR
jgi:hypothetical protein